MCYPMVCSPPGSSVHGILLARILDWVAIYFPVGRSQFIRYSLIPRNLLALLNYQLLCKELRRQI